MFKNMSGILRQIKLFQSFNWLTLSSYFSIDAHSNSYYSLNSEQIDKLRKSELKIYPTSYRNNYSPYYWTVKDYVYEKVFNFCNKEELAAAKNCVYGTNGDILTSFFFPFTKRDKHLATLFELQYLFFLIDDGIGFDESQEGFEDLVSVMIGDKTPVKPNEKITADINSVVRPVYSAAQYNRYVEVMCAYLMDCATEQKSAQKHFGSVQDLVEFRHHIIACKPFLFLIPFSIGIDVTEYTSNPLLIRLENLIVDHVIIVNDIFSMKKEVARREEQPPFNSLLFSFCKTNDLEESINYVFGLLDANEEEFLETRKELKSQFPLSTDLHEYMDGLEYFAGGNVIWSQCVPRYNRYNRYSLRNVVFKDNYKELIPEVERNFTLYTEKDL